MGWFPLDPTLTQVSTSAPSGRRCMFSAQGLDYCRTLVPFNAKGEGWDGSPSTKRSPGIARIRIRPERASIFLDVMSELGSDHGEGRDRFPSVSTPVSASEPMPSGRIYCGASSPARPVPSAAGLLRLCAAQTADVKAGPPLHLDVASRPWSPTWRPGLRPRRSWPMWRQSTLLPANAPLRLCAAGAQ